MASIAAHTRETGHFLAVGNSRPRRESSALPRPLTGGRGGALLLQQSVPLCQEVLHLLLVAALQLLHHLDVAVLHGGEAVRARDLTEGSSSVTTRDSNQRNLHLQTSSSQLPLVGKYDGCNPLTTAFLTALHWWDYYCVWIIFCV